MVDRILLTRPHVLQSHEINLTKFIPNKPEDIEEQIIITSHSSSNRIAQFFEDESTYKIKYNMLVQQFDEYKLVKEREIHSLKKHLEKLQEDLSDITQIKLDKIIKTQQLFHSQLLHCFSADDEFLRSTLHKKRKSTSND